MIGVCRLLRPPAVLLSWFSLSLALAVIIVSLPHNASTDIMSQTTRIQYSSTSCWSSTWLLHTQAAIVFYFSTSSIFSNSALIFFFSNSSAAHYQPEAPYVYYWWLASCNWGVFICGHQRFCKIFPPKMETRTTSTSIAQSGTDSVGSMSRHI